jgi:hypothetical protein
MRPIPLLFFALVVTILPAVAQPFRIATWQVSDVPIPRQTNAAAAAVVEPPRIAEISAALSAVDADAIILYGIIDSQALKRIAESIKPKKYYVAVHSVFRQNGNRGPVVGQPFGILAKRDKMSSKNIEWADTGRIDMPGGFTFASLRHGNGVVCVYVANLPGSLTNGVSAMDGPYFARKRNYAAEFLAFHSTWVTTTYTNQPFATYLAGDFSLPSKKPVKDDCAPILEKAGFRPVPVGNAQDKSTFAITNGPLVSRVFDPVFTRGIDFVATRQAPGPTATDQPMVICEVTLKPVGSASVAPPVRKSTPKPEPKSAPALEPVAPVPAPAPTQLAAASVVTPPPAKPAAIVTSAPTIVPVATAPKAHTENNPVQKDDATPATVSPATFTLTGDSWVWMAIAGASLGLLGLAVLMLRSSHRRNQRTALLRRPSEAVFVEMKSAPLSSVPVQRTGDAVLSAPTTATDNAHNGVWQAPSVRMEPEAPSHGKSSDPRSEVVPHIRQLLREKLFQWLSGQRQQLLQSQDAGTAQVMGLEERLDKLRGQFQNRLIEQEQRIAQMDRELEEKKRLLKESEKENPQGGDSKLSH